MPRVLRRWYPRKVRFGLGYPGWYLRRDTVRGAARYYRWASSLHPREMARRAECAASLQSDQPLFEISDDAGFGRFDVATHDIGRRAIDRCRELFETALRDSRFEGSLTKEFRAAHGIDLFAPENEPLLRFVLCSDVLAPICRYLGTVPVLLRPSLWYSPNERDAGRGSQRYHMDQSDHRQVKLFVNLDRVDVSSGPLTVVPAGRSGEIYERLKRAGVVHRRYQSLDDDLVRNLLGGGGGTVVVGETYGGIAIDTCRCYHYGSRPPAGPGRPRRVLLLQYASPFSKYMPVVGRQPRELRAPHLKSADAERARLVLGYSHLARHTVHPKQLAAPPP